MGFAHLMERKFVTDRIGLHWSIEQFEETRGLIGVEIRFYVRPAVRLP